MSCRPKRVPRIKIILDSNALFVPFELKIDLNERLADLLQVPYEVVLLSAVVEEMKTLASKGSPTIRKEAAFALRYAENYKITAVEQLTNESTDDLIVRVAKNWKSPVLTNDRQLIKKLRDINVPVIYVRQKSLLRMEGRISIPV